MCVFLLLRILNAVYYTIYKTINKILSCTLTQAVDRVKRIQFKKKKKKASANPLKSK